MNTNIETASRATYDDLDREVRSLVLTRDGLVWELEHYVDIEPFDEHEDLDLELEFSRFSLEREIARVDAQISHLEAAMEDLYFTWYLDDGSSIADLGADPESVHAESVSDDEPF